LQVSIGYITTELFNEFYENKFSLLLASEKFKIESYEMSLIFGGGTKNSSDDSPKRRVSRSSTG